jgi:hypothetical protein
VVLDGALNGRPDDAEGLRSGRGALYGLMEALASLPRDTPVIATAESTAMVVSHAEIQEALDDDDAICLALVRREPSSSGTHSGSDIRFRRAKPGPGPVSGTACGPSRLAVWRALRGRPGTFSRVRKTAAQYRSGTTRRLMIEARSL